MDQSQGTRAPNPSDHRQHRRPLLRVRFPVDADHRIGLPITGWNSQTDCHDRRCHIVAGQDIKELTIHRAAIGSITRVDVLSRTFAMVLDRIADGVGDVAPREPQAFLGDAVEVRCRDPVRVIGAECLLAVIVTENKQDIRPLIGGIRTGRRQH
ncbi:MAG: hypothetical protein AB7I48_01315 [Planctomycetaceae bacterium]